jgi:hypothetical protein
MGKGVDDRLLCRPCHDEASAQRCTHGYSQHLKMKRSPPTAKRRLRVRRDHEKQDQTQSCINWTPRSWLSRELEEHCKKCRQKRCLVDATMPLIAAHERPFHTNLRNLYRACPPNAVGYPTRLQEDEGVTEDEHESARVGRHGDCYMFIVTGLGRHGDAGSRGCTLTTLLISLTGRMRGAVRR